MARTPLSGGCVYADGYFRVDGEATFNHCEVGGDGESDPGPGGALYVGDTGSVLFNGALEISDVGILNDDRNSGGGIYKEKMSTSEETRCSQISGPRRVAPSTTASATNSTSGTRPQPYSRTAWRSTASVEPCTSNDTFKFSGPALFVIVNTDAPSIYGPSEGVTVLSEESVFWDNDDNVSPADTSNTAVLVAAGGQIDVPSSVCFYDNDDPTYTTVLFEEDQICLGEDT